MKVDHAITEDEAALYDRQIRLWGIDAQKRLIYIHGNVYKWVQCCQIVR